MPVKGTCFKPYLATLLALLAVLPLTVQAAESDAFAAARAAMVSSQIESRGVADPRVLEVMASVPRHRFIPDQTLWPMGYTDMPLPIGYQQTISQPYIVAVMTENLRLQPGHKVLEIGTGSGYQAAVLAELVDQVYSIEIVPQLGEHAASVLAELGYANVSVRVGDGYQGWPEQAPFDRIIVTAAPETVPQALVDQLRPGGRMILPVGSQAGAQDLMVVSKDAAGNVSSETLFRVLFVPMVPGNGR